MRRIGAFIKRYPALTFYALVFAISWGGILTLVGPGRIPGTAEDVERLFPFALVAQFAGPSIAGILMTGLVSGRAGLRELFTRLLRWRARTRWYAVALLTGPLLVAAVLFALSLVSPVFLPGIVTADDRLALLLFGLAWGLIGGGLLEELGWTGFAVPRLGLRYDPLATGLIVGLLWGAWHFLIAFWASSALAGEQSLVVFVTGFLAFYIVALPAYRVLMVRVYNRTASLPVAMLMHAFFSASTLILQPQTTAGHLTWNLVLSAALWVVVAAVAASSKCRGGLTQSRWRHRMTEAETETRYRRYIGFLNERRTGELGEFVHDVLTYNGKPMTRFDYQDMIAGNIAAIPDLHFDIHLLIADRDRIACRLRFDCTPKGEFLGLQPTGKPVSFSEHVFYRFRDGKIYEVWSLIDRSALEAQLAP